MQTNQMPANTRMLKFAVMGDDRGSLVAVEGEKSIPFPIARAYYIFGTSEGVRRGYHAHADLNQVAICVKGRCSFLVDDGTTRATVELGSPTEGLLIGPMIWREMFDFSEDCVLLVLASKHYDAADYIRDYDEFLKTVRLL